MELFVDVHVVKRHAIVDVLCGPVVNVVIGVHVFVLSVPLVVVRVVPIFLAVILYQFIPLFHRSHFSHMFSLYSHGMLGVVFYKKTVSPTTRIDLRAMTSGPLRDCSAGEVRLHPIGRKHVVSPDFLLVDFPQVIQI